YQARRTIASRLGFRRQRYDYDGTARLHRSLSLETAMPSRFSPARLARGFLAIGAIGLVASCHSAPLGGSGGRAATDKGTRTVGVSVLTLGNPFFRVIGDHLTAELEKGGYKAVVVAGEFDVAKQQQQVRDFIVNKYAAIVLCPCNSK